MIKLEKAQLKDARCLKEIAIRAFKEDYELYGSMPTNIEKEEWHSENIKYGLYYMILFEDKVVGGIRLFRKGVRHMRIGTIYLDPDYQNKDIGSNAISQIEKLFTDVEVWSLDTPYKSYRNHHFYEKLGYVKVGEVYPEPEREFCLFEYEKTL